MTTITASFWWQQQPDERALRQKKDRLRREERILSHLDQLHRNGSISDAMLLIYGISGDMPDVENYSQLTTEQKNTIWGDRMKRRFGPNWIQRFENRSLVLPVVKKVEKFSTNWKKEGF